MLADRARERRAGRSARRAEQGAAQERTAAAPTTLQDLHGLLALTLQEVTGRLANLEAALRGQRLLTAALRQRRGGLAPRAGVPF